MSRKKQGAGQQSDKRTATTMTVTHTHTSERTPSHHLSSPSSPTKEEKTDVYEMSTDDVEPSVRPNCIRKTTKYVIFALAVFFGQIAISVTLKRYGVIEKDFNEMVAERVVPHLQNGLEQSGLLPQFNESLYWIRSFNQTFPSMPGTTAQTRVRPGFQLAQNGAKAKYPVVMVPGFVTSALEVWQGKECAKHLFRQRLWGGVGMVQQWFTNRQCAVEHMTLDPMTGKDPEDIRIRAASGFEAADYFAGNYWVWSKLLVNLADIGYDGNMMSIETYDWRLAFPMLEERDGYLTKLKFRIEGFVKYSGKKVVVASHSMGCLLVHYFFAWVVTPEKQGGGGGGKHWVDKHIHAYINVAGAQLGAPKSASSLLSGEMSDTVVMGSAGGFIEQFLGRKVRKDLWNTWGSLWSLLPKGGAGLWNVGADLKKLEGYNEEQGPHDGLEDYLIVLAEEEEGSDETNPSIGLNNHDLVDDLPKDSTAGEAVREFSSRNHHTLDHITDFLKKWGGGCGPKTASARWHSFDPHEKHSPATWHDLSRTPLPHAPKLNIYCFYGVGLDTERAYYYRRNTVDGGTDNHSHSKTPVDPPFILDTSVEDPANKVIHGVRYADGDGSVPLLSLGYLCADAWRRKETGLNPSRSKVVTREYTHRQELVFDDPMRGGPYSGEHVDVMGNLDMMQDFLKVVSDFELETVEDKVVSGIYEIAERIAKHPKGGLKKIRQRHFW
jgi:phospholipid:diacylglycerol acyltransferase